jgi:hypothetical protein
MAVMVTPSTKVQADARTWTVDRLDDPNTGADADGDGMFDATVAASACAAATNDCSLRGAIQRANLNTGHSGATAHTDTINFGTLTGTITLVGDGLRLNDATLAATTITGPTSLGILVTGGAGDSCFELVTPTNTIQGLVISGCGADGIHVLGTSTGNFIRGNRIGTNAAGTAAFPNTNDGIELVAGSNGNTIGGTVAGQANVVSGNALVGVTVLSNANTVSGNLIGTDATGVYAVPNAGAAGISIGGALTGSGNTVGGTTAGSRNIISGNAGVGVLITGAGATGNVVQGNCIGTQIDCASPRPNGASGVRLIALASGNVIGGTANVISQNVGDGVLVSGVGTLHNRISRNQTSANGLCGIYLAGGNGDLVPAAMLAGPTISAITYGGGTSFTVAGAAASAIPGSTVEIFVASNDVPNPCLLAHAAAPTGEGSCLVGQAVADGAGAWSATVHSIGGYSIVTTQTNAAASTSEFGTSFGAPAGPSGASCGLPAPVATSTPSPAPTATTAPTSTPAGSATPTRTATPVPGAATATPTTGPMESVTLAGNTCNPVASTYPDDTPIATIAGAVSPSANLLSIWWLDAASGRWLGYSPQFVAQSDLTAVDRLEAIFICVSSASTWSRPLI